MNHTKRSRRIRTIGLLVLVGLAMFVFRAPLVRATMALAIDAATGDRVSFSSFERAAGDPHVAPLNGGAIFAKTPGLWWFVVRDVHVENALGPLVDVGTLAVAVDPGELWPTSSHRFGLHAVELDRAALRIARARDGALSIGSFGGQASSGPTTPEARYALDLGVARGSIRFDDPYRVLAGARWFDLSGFALRGVVDTAGVTTYAGTGIVTTPSGPARDPVRIAGRIDTPRAFALHRLTAARLPVDAIANYFINSPTAAVIAGTVRDFSIAAYAIGAPAYHFSGGGRLDHVGLRIPGLAVPAREMTGPIALCDAGIAAPAVGARIGPVPVRVAGGVIDWAAPRLRLGVTGAADFERLRGLFRFSSRLPISGPMQLTSLIEGPVGSPLVDSRVSSSRMVYGGFPVEGVRGRIVYAEQVVDALPVTGRYGASAVAVDGTIALGTVAHPRLFADVAGPAAAVPYAAQAAPGSDLHASGYLEGDGIALDAEGLLDGAGPATRIAGLFHLDHRGDGAFGPLLVRRSSGASLAGTLYMNRSENESGFWVAANHFPAAYSRASLPGLPEFGPPPFAGLLDGAVVGDGHPTTFRLAAALDADDLSVSGVRIAHVRAGVTGNFQSMRLGGIRADGAWGSVAGDGTFAGKELALVGTYRGSFEQLETFTGKLGGRGPITGPVALVLGPDRTVVQARDDRSSGSVQGVPVGDVAGTLTVRGKRLDVLAADVGLPGAALAMAGTLRRDGGLGVSIAGADARDLRAAGSPLDAGRVALIGDFGSGDPGRPRFRGGLAVGGGRVGDYRLEGDSDVRLAAGGAALDGAAASLDGAYGRIDGTVSGLANAGLARRRPVAYDLGIRLRDVSLRPFGDRALPGDYVDGSLDGDLHVAGLGNAPTLDGTLAVRGGTISGQFVRELGGRVKYDGERGTQIAGHLAVGSTLAHFSLGSGVDTAHARLVAARANLADFNDLFDQGDVLGGTGRLDLFFTKSGAAVNTSADLAIAKLRYRSFDLGDAMARWSSSGNRVAGKFAFGGSSGHLAVDGTLTLASQAPLDRVLQRSSFDGRADLDGLDLGTWLPALGYNVPITGRVDADATLRGPLSSPFASTHATLFNGSIGKFPIDRFELAASSNLNRTTIQSADLELLTLKVTGNGSFGLAPKSPIALNVHAVGGDIGALAAKLFGAGKAQLSGRAETDVTIGGTRAHPKVVAGFDVENAAVAGIAIPRALGELSLEGRDLVLTGAEVGFAKGALQLAGSLPLELDPFSIGPGSAPLALDASASGIDMTDFAALLPAGSTLKGRFDGHVALGGTVAEPRLTGQTTLAGGVLESPFEREQLANISALLTFRGRGARLDSFHAEAGGGSLDATGRIRFADLTHPTTDGQYQLDAKAKALHLDLPEFGRGTLDGTFGVAHVPGSLPTLTAAATVQDAIIPFSALLLAAGSTTSGPPESVVVPAPGTGLPQAGDVRLALSLNAGRNVRVRSGNVDIGGKGAIAVSGTRFAPALSGGFESTGGTLTYFNTLFRVQRGTVTFEPDLGVIPYLDATATTHVTDSDPNPTRNLSGFADITLDITGPVTNLAINLQSDPPYGREQILGLLLSAPQLGATSLFDPNGSAIQPIGSLPNQGGVGASSPRTLGTLEAQRQTTAPGNIFGTTVGEEAFGVVNAQFTRNLLAPFETAFSDAIGLSAVNINVDYTGNVGLTARKILGKTVNAIYATTLGYPYRQSVGFELRPNESTAAQVTVFQTIGNEILGLGVPNTVIVPASTNYRIGSAQPSTGTIGFSLSLQRLLK